MTDKLSIANTNLAAIKEIVPALTRKLEELNERIAAENVDWSTKYRNIKNTMVTIEAKLGDIGKSIEQTTMEIDKLTTDNAAGTKTTNELREKVCVLLENRDDLNGEIEQDQKKMSQLQHDLDTTTATIDNFTAINVQQLKRIDELKKKIDEKEKEKRDLAASKLMQNYTQHPLDLEFEETAFEQKSIDSSNNSAESMLTETDGVSILLDLLK